MTLPIAVQLYSVREQSDKDYAGTIRRIAEMGYIGVEGVRGYPDGVTPADAAKLFRELNLEVVGVHVALPFGADEAPMLSLLETLNCKTAICPWLDPKQYFNSLDSVKKACEMLNKANEVYRKHGYTFGYHNHAFEAVKFDGRPALQHMIDLLDPTVIFELDTYWIQTGGVDVIETLKQLGNRAPLLHIKDGPVTPDGAMVAVGSGKMDFKKIIPEVQNTAKWLIVELDRTDGDMIEAVRGSYQYLTSEGLAHGRK